MAKSLVYGAAKVDSTGKIYPLGPRTGTSLAITDDDVKDTKKLARLVEQLVGDLAALKGRFYPRWLDFEDVAVTAAGKSYPLTHNFNGRVRWWVVGWQCPTNVAPILREDTSVATDANTLSLLSYVAGTVTVRVEEAG